jgi:hypothetical protein
MAGLSPGAARTRCRRGRGGSWYGSLIAQGLTPLIREFNGTALASGPSALSSIAFSKSDLECWVGLAILTVLAMWTYERPDLPGVYTARTRIHAVIESAKVILLLYVVFRSIWKGIDLATRRRPGRPQDRTPRRDRQGRHAPHAQARVHNRGA